MGSAASAAHDLSSWWQFTWLHRRMVTWLMELTVLVYLLGIPGNVISVWQYLRHDERREDEENSSNSSYFFTRSIHDRDCLNHTMYVLTFTLSGLSLSSSSSASWPLSALSTVNSTLSLAITFGSHHLPFSLSHWTIQIAWPLWPGISTHLLSFLTDVI